MHLNNWLNSIRERIRRRTSGTGSGQAPARSRRRPRNIECLEQRTLLTVQVVQIDNDLLITSDASDSIAIRPNTDVPPLVEVVANGSVVPGLGDIDASTVAKITIIGDDGDNTIDLSAVSAAIFSSTALELIIDGGDGDDTIIGSIDFTTTIDGNDGDDTITGGSAADIVNGGDGRDLINVLLGDDTVNGGDGADVINGDLGNDVINGGASADTIDGADGDDILNGDTGNDSITGAAGNDTINGGSDNDELFGNEGDDSIEGGGGNDSILGEAGMDTLDGQGGTDTILGGDDNDTLRGGAGADSLNGGIGDDFINGQGGDDTLLGLDDDDTIFGGGGNDLIFGDGNSIFATNLGNDRIRGNSGNDTIQGGLGSDTIDGDSGDDLIQTSDLGLTVNDVAIDEGAAGETSTLTFTVLLSSPLPDTVTVDFVVSSDGTPAGGTATDGVDYTSPGMGTLTYLPGETEKTVNVLIIGDDIDESDETFLLTLSNPVNAPIRDDIAEGRILDDDPTPPVDIFFLFDDTGSFTNALGTTGAAFPQIISDLQANFPGRDFAFGVGRYEDYSGGFGSDRPFILNQPIITDDTPMFQQSIDAAFRTQTFFPVFNPGRTAPGGGGSLPESAIEALFQVATGAGFDGNDDGDTVDSGPAGLFTTQTMPGPGGDVPNYSTFTPDPTGDINGPILPPTVPVPVVPVDGVGWRPGTQRFVILATDAAFTVADEGIDPYVGVGGVTVPASQILNGSQPPPAAVLARAATVQSTIDELIADNTQVIGLFDPAFPGIQTVLEGVATLTGAVNRTPNTVESGITPGPSPDDIAPGDPLAFQININDPNGLATSVVTAITAGVNPNPPAPPPAPPGSDFIDDTLRGGTGNDTIQGADGNDILDGQDGNDSLTGGGGMDTLLSGEGNDTLEGGTGDDEVTGEEGGNTLDGGGGFDTVTIEPFADGTNTSLETSGADTVIILGTDDANTFTIGQNSDDLMVVSTSTATIVISESARTVIIEGLAGADTFTLSDINRIPPVGISFRLGDGGDTFNGQSSALGFVPIEILGGDGPDTINGSAGRDLIDGGGDADVINGDRGDDSIQGGLGNDTITGGRDNDSLEGGDGDDNLNGNVGDDIVRGDNGNDFLNGQSGDDTIDGGLGDDTIFAGSGRDLATGGPGADNIKGNSGNDTLFGQGGDDTLNGNAGNDVINGGDGDDSIRGATGDDLITGADGTDFINAQAGNDTVLGGDGDDSLFGGGGQDVVLGGDGDDVVRGNGSSRDTVAGNEGDNDDLTGNRAGEIDESFTLSATLLSALDEPT